MRCCTVFASLLALLAAVCQGATLTVHKDGSGDFLVIQHALDAAADGDTVLIGPGVYTESTMVRLPGWAYDIESYAHLRSDDVTIIGAGADQTTIGPASYAVSPIQWSPIGVTYDAGRLALNISDLGVRNCDGGVYLLGTLYMDRCVLQNSRLGLNWGPVGSGGWVRDSIIEASGAIASPMSFSIGVGSTGSGIELRGNRFGNASSVRGVQGLAVWNCEFTGLNLYYDISVYVHSSSSVGNNIGITILAPNTYCEIVDSQIGGTASALVVGQGATGSRYVVSNCRIEGGSQSAFRATYTSGPCAISSCDLVKGTGPMVVCESPGSALIHDLRNNFWGTSDDSTIRSWIFDHADDPNIGATVLYSPFAGESVPTESTSWGDLKAIFR